MLRLQVVGRRLVRPGNGFTQKLDIAAALKPYERFVDAQRQLEVVAAFAAHRAFKVDIHLVTLLRERHL
jgi:hypothetical protein